MNQAAAAIEALLAARGERKTICPSEAARLLAGSGGDWRAAMPQVHAAACDLAYRQAVRLSWKGAPVGPAQGPYRISRA